MREMDFYSLNESTDCAHGDELQNGTVYESLDPANITCGNAFAVRIPEVPEREQKAEDHTLRILLYALIFLLSVLGNLLIIVVLAVNRRMRTVTNSFLLSLAVSDLMMAVFCMPFNLIPNILKDFIFGAAMCRIVAYLMGISVSISTFSLVAIAIERYSAICNPLKSRAWQTRSHAYRVIAATWLLAFVLMIPYPVISHLEAHQRPDNTTAHQCRHMWPQVKAEQTWFILLLMLLFVIPGVVMIVAYGLISRELYRGIQFEMGHKRVSTMLKNGLASASAATSSGGDDDGDGCYVHNVSPQPPHPPSVEMSTLSASGGGVARQAEEPPRLRSNTSEAKLEAKKRVIRMLVVIVAMFFVCWMPLYCVNTWRAFDNKSAVLALSGAPISFILLLSYSSACVNPIIYCFMNTRFRKALISTFACRAPCCRSRQSLSRSRRRHGLQRDEEDAMTTGTSVSRFSYTTVSSVGTC